MRTLKTMAQSFLIIIFLIKMNDNLMSEDGISAQQITHQTTTKPLLNFKVQPGFQCFFQSYIQSNNQTYYQCYQKLLKNSLQMDRVRFPLSKILQDDKMNIGEKINKIIVRASPHEKIYIQMQNQNVNVYSYGKQKQEEANNLQKQIQLYRRQNQETLLLKKKQFKMVREKQQAVINQQYEQKKRRQAILEKTQLWLKMNSNQKQQNIFPPPIFYNLKVWVVQQKQMITNQLQNLSNSIKKILPQ